MVLKGVVEALAPGETTIQTGGAVVDPSVAKLTASVAVASHKVAGLHLGNKELWPPGRNSGLLLSK
jgi:hypothetical protein